MTFFPDNGHLVTSSDRLGNSVPRAKAELGQRRHEAAPGVRPLLARGLRAGHRPEGGGWGRQ